MKKRLLSRVHKYISPRLVVLLFVTVPGIALLVFARASVSTVAIEAENGSKTANIGSINGDTASNGSAIKFAKPSSALGQKCNQLTNLKFCDDFDSAAGTAPDSTKWRILTYSAWGGQCYKDNRQNIAHDGQGNLKMTLIDTGSTQCTTEKGYPTNVTSGAMDTGGKAYFRYGKYEIRAKLSCAQSVWGAIWTASGTGPAWPESGEIDMYEIIGTQTNRLQQTIWAGNPKWHKSTFYTISKPLCQDYHVYGMEWRQGYIQFTLDGVNTNRVTPADAGSNPWPFDTYDQRMIISLEYGGEGYTSQGPYDLTELPSSMLIDYVHVFN